MNAIRYIAIAFCILESRFRSSKIFAALIQKFKTVNILRDWCQPRWRFIQQK